MSQQGKIKFFNTEKGFGFITPKNGGDDVFVHVTGLKDEVRQDDEVTFNTEKGKKGMCAVDVELV